MSIGVRILRLLLFCVVFYASLFTPFVARDIVCIVILNSIIIEFKGYFLFVII